MQEKTLKILKKLYESAQYRGKEVKTVLNKKTLTAIDMFNLLQFGLAMGGVMNITNQEFNYPNIQVLTKTSNPEIYKRMTKLNESIGVNLVREVNELFIKISAILEQGAKDLVKMMSKSPSDEQH